MLNKIDHVGIAVEDLNKVIETYKTIFNMEPSFIENIDEQKVKAAGFKVGESNVEFLEATENDSPIAKYITKKGSGIHHIAFQVDNIQQTLITLKKKNIGLIDEQPREGAEGKKIAFIHPHSTNGVLIELCENKKPSPK